MHETVDGVTVVSAGAVQGAVAQDGIRQMVHGLVVLNVKLAGLLAAAVEAAGFAVHVQGAGEDVPLDIMPAAGLQGHNVANHIDTRGVDGSVVGLADIGDARVIADDVSAFHGFVRDILVKDAAHDHLLIGTQPA